MKLHKYKFDDWINLIAERMVLNNGFLSKAEEQAHLEFLEFNSNTPWDEEEDVKLSLQMDKAVIERIEYIVNNEINIPNWEKYEEYLKNLNNNLA